MKNVITVASVLAFCSILGTSSLAFAKDEHIGSDCTSCHTLSPVEAGTLLKDIGQVKSVKNSTVKGLFEVVLERGGRQTLVYVDFAKKHVFPGPIFSIASKTPIATPLPPARKEPAKVSVASIPLDHSIVMGNPKGTKKLIVFTDPDCPFCSRLHAELKQLIKMDGNVVVYIKMFPLSIHPNSFDKARVILGRQSLELLDKAFNHEQLPLPGDGDPKNLVEESIKLGERLGVNSTPTIILPDGQVVAGTRDAKSLFDMLGH